MDYGRTKFYDITIVYWVYDPQMGIAGSDPMEVRYNVQYFWPYFVEIFPYIDLKIGLVDSRYLQFRFLEWPVKWGIIIIPIH